MWAADSLGTGNLQQALVELNRKIVHLYAEVTLVGAKRVRLAVDAYNDKMASEALADEVERRLSEGSPLGPEMLSSVYNDVAGDAREAVVTAMQADLRSIRFRK